MNISVNGLLQQMRSQIEAAEQAAHTNERAVREHIRALHSLCELLLNEQTERSESPRDFQSHLHVMEHGIRKSAPASNTTDKLEGSKLKEDDANGDSIFDF